jgi:alpha-glucosidase
MPISFPFRRTLSLYAGALLCAALLTAADAQTLARPGWAGSGLTSELWWRNAVFYRIDVPSFQDSNGDGKGDLRGVADRMDYLQALGVDAIAFEHADIKDEGFDDALHAAIPRQIRVLITLDDKGTGNDEALAAEARNWLTRGASGIFLRSTRSATDAAPLIARMRALTNSFAGERILLSQTSTNPAPGEVHAISIDGAQAATRSKRAQGQPGGAQLTAVPLELTNATAKTIRVALNGLNNGVSSGSLFLTEHLYSSKELLAPEHLAALDGRRRAFALVLLASRGAASLRYGQEIGMLPMEGSDAPMQWTPTNVTPAPKTEAKEEEPRPLIAPVPTAEDQAKSNGGYGAFVPYVAPKKPASPAAKTVQGEVVEAPPEPVDPKTLPGFTSGILAKPVPADAAKLNAAMENADPDSLLNMYRRLTHLHHDYPALHNGTQTLLDYDALDAVVWVRQAQGDSRSAIIAVCNLSGAPLHLSLNEELAKQRIHTGSIRNLLSSTASQTSVQSTDNLTLPPYGIFLGELYH